MKKCNPSETFKAIFIAGTISLLPLPSSATVSNAAGFGFNHTDVTTSIQKAIDSKADTVIVVKMDTSWIVTPLFARSPNQTIIFKPGVELLAKSGAFQGSLDGLLRISANNVTIIGYGATFRMMKSEYTTGEWRHCIWALGKEGMKILGLTLRESGGDGIYVSAEKNILIKDVIADNNRRQGISVICAESLSIENCILDNTTGTNPMGGIDFEPNNEAKYIVNTKMTNCFLKGNLRGLYFSIGTLASNSAPISATFESCHATGNRSGGIDVCEFGEDKGSPKGALLFRNCSIVGNAVCGIEMTSLPANTYSRTFENCLISDNGNIPIFIKTVASANFMNCTVNQLANAAFVKAIDATGISGSFVVNCPYGATTTGVDKNVFTITENKTRPPSVKISSPLERQIFVAGNAVTLKALANDPDVGTADGSGIAKVVFVLHRGTKDVFLQEDATAPFEAMINTTGYEQGIYMVRATAVSKDGAGVINLDVTPMIILGTGSTGINEGRKTFLSSAQESFHMQESPNSFFFYALNTSDSKLRITDVFGRSIGPALTSNDSYEIPKNHLSSGIYVISITKDNQAYGKRILLSR